MNRQKVCVCARFVGFRKEMLAGPSPSFLLWSAGLQPQRVVALGSLLHFDCLTAPRRALRSFPAVTKRFARACAKVGVSDVIFYVADVEPGLVVFPFLSPTFKVVT